MAFPDGWTRRCVLTIPTSAALSDFPVLFTAANLPDELFTLAQVDGGDIRFTSDEAGATRLPVDLVSYSSSGAALIWVAADLSDAAEIYIWYGSTGESQPAADDAYGRNAVWAEAELAVLMESATPVDRTGNHTLSYSGSYTGISGPFGDALTFGASAHMYNGDAGLIGMLSTFDTTIEVVARKAVKQNDKTVVSFSGTDDWLLYTRDGNSTGKEVRAYWRDAGGSANFWPSGVAGPDWHWAAFTVASSTSESLYLNGESLLDASVDISATGPYSYFDIGAWENSQYWAGDLQSVIVWRTARSADWLATSYASQSDPATFIDVGTPQAVGGDATVLTVADASHAQVADSVTLSQVHDLAIGAAVHAQTADAVGITQNHVLSVAAALHAQTADNAGLGQNHVISADNSAHGQSAGTASIAQNQILGVQGAAHGQIAANIEIEVAGSLAPDGARHSHVAGTVTLVQNHSVAIDGAIQPQTSGAAELSLFSHIAPANVMQAHSAGNVTLSQVHALSVQDARHGQAASGPDVFEAISVPVDSATHGITSDNVDIAQQHVLDVAGCSHAHSAETVILAQVHFLATTFAQHAQLADNVTVTPISDAAPTDRTIGIPDDRRSTVRVGPRPVINVTSSR